MGGRHGPRHVARLRRALALLEVKGYDTSETVLACYGGAGFDPELRAEADRQRLLLIDLGLLYGA